MKRIKSICLARSVNIPIGSENCPYVSMIHCSRRLLKSLQKFARRRYEEPREFETRKHQLGARGTGAAFHTSCAYSLTRRSTENQPIFAMLRIALRAQSVWS